MLEAARDLGAAGSTFRRVTLPDGRPASSSPLLLTCLPMLGDYFTSDLLSGSPETSMVGNLINNSVLTPGQTGQAGAFVLLVLLVSLSRCCSTCAAPAPRGSSRDARERPVSALTRLVAGPVAQAAGPQRDHDRLPVLVAAARLIAVLFSFNAGRSRTVWQGFSFRWYWGDPERSVWHDAAAHGPDPHAAARRRWRRLITVPLGVALRARARPLARTAPRARTS